MVLATLGLGALLGYAAAAGKLPLPAWSASGDAPPLGAAPACAPCAAPNRDAMFTSAKGEKTPKAGNPRGSTTGPTDAPGYDHPNQFIHMKPTQIAPNMEPVMVHPKQLKEAMAKLAKMKSKHGKTPNFLVFLMDDVGWMDPGFNGGGTTVGNPTPNMDRIARKGKILRSAYSTPSCSPSRASIL